MTLRDKKLMVPLWFAYPKTERYSIGWRWGSAESYAGKFWEWFDALSCDEQEEYKQLFPEPKDWAGIYDDILEDNGISCGKFYVYNWQPKYGRNWLQRQLEEEGRTKEFLFFSEEESSKNGKVDVNCLGLSWKEQFNFIDTNYDSLKDYILRSKLGLIEDEETANQIYDCKLDEFETLVENSKDLYQKSWEKYRYYILLNGIWYKFFQNKDLRDYLISTGDRVLVYADLDDVFGIGLSIGSEEIKDPSKWKGQNLLGFGLMIIRDELQRVTKNEALLDYGFKKGN